jgi:hypothetical protein
VRHAPTSEQEVTTASEFLSTMILPTFTLTTLVATILSKKKRKPKPQLPYIFPCTFSVIRLMLFAYSASKASKGMYKRWNDEFSTCHARGVL